MRRRYNVRATFLRVPNFSVLYAFVIFCLIKGRNGRGSIYVFSSGKGVVFGDNCAFNGFVNNIQTIAVAALDRNGMPSIKSAQCSAVMTAAVCGNLV